MKSNRVQGNLGGKIGPDKLASGKLEVVGRLAGVRQL